MTVRPNMTRIPLKAAAIALGLITAGAAGSAIAHHSFAMFDFSKTVTVKGVVKEFQWTNPHVIVWVLGEEQPGAGQVLWSAELTSPGNLTRMGWTKRSLNPGDRVSLELNPLRDGKKGGGFHSVTLIDTGVVLKAGGPGQLPPATKAP